MRSENLLRSVLMSGFGLVVLVTVSSPASAAFHAPEIITTSTAGAVALLVGSGMILAERMGLRRK